MGQSLPSFKFSLSDARGSPVLGVGVCNVLPSGISRLGVFTESSLSGLCASQQYSSVAWASLGQVC